MSSTVLLFILLWRDIISSIRPFMLSGQDLKNCFEIKKKSLLREQVILIRWIFVSIAQNGVLIELVMTYKSTGRAETCQTQAKWNMLERDDNKVVICCYKIKFVSICLCGFSRISVLFATKFAYLRSICDVTKACTGTWRFGICLWYSKYEHQGYC